MRAAVAHRATAHAPIQRTLLEVEARPVRCAIVGTLLRHAEVRVGVDDSAHLAVHVMQPRDALAFVAVLHVKADGANDLRHRAMAMRAGTGVLVLGTGLSLSSYDGDAVIKLHHTLDIRSVEAADYFTALDEGAAA